MAANFDPDNVTPGTVGFIATFLLAVAVFFLIRDMARRVRRVRYREQIAEQDRLEEEGDGDTDGHGPTPGGKHGPDAPDPMAEYGPDSGHPSDGGNDDGEPPASRW